VCIGRGPTARTAATFARLVCTVNRGIMNGVTTLVAFINEVFIQVVSAMEKRDRELCTPSTSIWKLGTAASEAPGPVTAWQSRHCAIC
jgi:hypothetical protein